MKNIITILLILIIPVTVYFFLTKNNSDFIAEANGNTNPTLMTFTSSMCMDCQKMKSILSEVEPLYAEKINFVHINALDKNKKVKDYIKKFSIVLVPTMIFLDNNGNEINKIEGAVSKEELIKEIEEAVNE